VELPFGLGLTEIGLIIASGTAIGLIIETIVLFRQLKQAKDNQYDETLRKCMSDLYQVYRTDFDVKTKAECELLATRVLDILAILAHLNLEGKLDKKMLDFVKFDLEIGKGIMKWFDEEKLGVKYDPSSSEEIWSNLTRYFKKYKIKICKEDALPDCIKNFNNLK
jgi:hypothetical protein